MTAVENIPKLMKATKLYGAMDLRLDEFPIPALKPRQVLLKVNAIGICSSGLKMLKDPERIEKAFWDIPGFPGHETSAEVINIGAEVDRFTMGDRVVPTGGPTCGYCISCRKGAFRFCENQDFGSIEYMSFGEYMIANVDTLLPIPAGLSDEGASFAEPLGCCIASVEKCSLNPGDFAAIIGAGTMGLLHLQLFLSMGARVLVVEPDEGRREFARIQGADLSVEPDEAKDTILDHTNGRGAQAVVIAAGVGKAVELGFDLVFSGGTLMLFAGIWPSTTIQIDPNLIHYKQINVTGSVGALMIDFEKALALMNNGAVDVAPMISETYPLDEIMEAHRASERSDTYKVIVKP